MIHALFSFLVSVLPTPGTDCQSALEVARTIDCQGSRNPWACYRTVAAQYNALLPDVLAAADCDLLEQGCGLATLWCSYGGPAAPTLGFGDTTASCQNDAGQEAVSLADSCWPCRQMIAAYGDTDPDVPGCM